MNASPVVAGVLIGILVSFPAGMLYAAVRRSWTDFSGAKKAIPGARKIALGRTREALIFGLLLTVAGAVAIGLARGR